jgi:hypothetical protein
VKFVGIGQGECSDVPLVREGAANVLYSRPEFLSALNSDVIIRHARWLARQFPCNQAPYLLILLFRGYLQSLGFPTPPVIGADGIGTGFGNSGTGIVDGPGQVNVDVSLSKPVALRWPREGSSVEFRAEFCNTLNHPQFANPDANFSSATFGVITSTAVNARVGQLGLKFRF